MKPIPDLAANPAGLQGLFGALDGPQVLVGVYDPAIVSNSRMARSGRHSSSIRPRAT